MDHALVEPGSLLGSRYRVESVLGQGGMGAVYLARAETLDKRVAVKEMWTPAGATLDEAVVQFRREARFLANLEHRNLVGVSDYFEEDGRHYLVMSYVDGKTLHQLMQERIPPLPVAEVLDWAGQLLSVLSYLHAQDPPLLFRDLKPANVMLDKTGTIRLVDFGIARTGAPGEATATFLQGVGSEGYAPLEQYHGAGGTDVRSDIYSLGATLFHLLTGQKPPSAARIVTEGLRTPSARELNPGIPAALDGVLQRMMALLKEERFQSARQASLALAAVAEGDLEPTEDLSGPAGASEPAYLTEGEHVFPISHTETLIGRQAPAQLRFSNPQVSRQHLRLTRTSRGYVVADLASRFGTFLNGRPVTGEQPIQDGDELVLGGVLSLRFRDPSQTQGGRRVGRLKGVWIDADSADVWLDGQLLSPPLSAAQLALLKLLESRPGAFVSREEMVAAVWPDSALEGVSEEAVDGLIKRVRGRLREAGRDPIEVRRGHGLRLFDRALEL